MINVILDTNILHQEGLSSKNMQVLSRLSRLNKIIITVPDLVAREFVSKKIQTSKENIIHARSKLEPLKKNIGQEHELTNDISQLELKLKELHQNIEEPINQNFENWVKTNNIFVPAFKSEDILSVMGFYFSGGGGFRNAKARDDIPDAMIAKIIESEVQKNQDCIVVINDGNFRDYLNTSLGIKTAPMLKDLLNSDPIKSILIQLDRESKIVEQIKVILSDGQVQGRLKNFLTSDKSYLDSIYLTDSDVSDLDETLAMAVYAVEIESIDSSTIQNVKFGDIRFIDDDFFSIEIQFSAESPISYCTDYGSYVGLSEEDKSHITFDSMNSDGICELSEIRDFQFDGNMEIYLHSQMEPEEFKTHTLYISNEDCLISASVEIKNAAPT
jgi:rRNA-processing protein FCF1